MNSFFEDKHFEIHEELKISSLREFFPQNESYQGWQNLLENFSKKPDFEILESQLIKEYSSNYCFPKPHQIFRALELTPLEETRVVILGQDPYHGRGQADGLAFSVPSGINPPPSLRNILKELYYDLGIETRSTDLSGLAKQGVLLLNTCLSVRISQPGSHKRFGWEQLIELIISELNKKDQSVIFVLWGKNAENFEKSIDLSKHRALKSAHPSPLSAFRGFFGSKPFSNVNNALIDMGYNEINWLM